MTEQMKRAIVAAKYRIALGVRLERDGYPGAAAASLRDATKCIPVHECGRLLEQATRMTDLELYCW